MSQRKKVTFEGDSRGTITPAQMQQPPRSPDSSDSKEASKDNSNPAPATTYFSFPYPTAAYPYAWPQMTHMYGMYHPYPYAPVVPVAPVPVAPVAPVVAPVESKQVTKDEKVVTPSDVPQKRTLTSPNLDDPEELERWKAERRKRFPGRAKEVEEEKKPQPQEVKEEDAKSAQDDLEEGETTEEPGKRIKKRPCKYFAAGKCRNGDACSFSHVQKSKAFPTSSVQTGQTVFENLQAKQEREDLLKFYECLKRLARVNK